MIWVAVPDTTSHGGHHRIVSRLTPSLKVIAGNPNDIRKTLISLAKVLPINSATTHTVRECHAGPITRLKRVQEQLNTVRSGHSNDRIHAPEIDLVGRRQIVNVSRKFFSERDGAIQHAAVVSA